MTKFSFDAARKPEAENISVELIHYSSVKPFDVGNPCAKSASKTGGVVTVENRNTVGGFGSAACEALSADQPRWLKRLGGP